MVERLYHWKEAPRNDTPANMVLLRDGMGCSRFPGANCFRCPDSQGCNFGNTKKDWPFKKHMVIRQSEALPVD